MAPTIADGGAVRPWVSDFQIQVDHKNKTYQGLWTDSKPPTANIAGFRAHTCSFDRDQLILEVRLDLDDALELVQRLRNILDAAVTCHGYRENSLFQDASATLG